MHKSKLKYIPVGKRTFIRKPFFNKRNGQITVTIPKRKVSKKLHFNPDLFIEIRALRRRK